VKAVCRLLDDRSKVNVNNWNIYPFSDNHVNNTSIHEL
jgi:hypothetical protein